MKLATRTIDFVIYDDYDRKLFVIGIEAAMKPKAHIINNPSRLFQIRSYCKFYLKFNSSIDSLTLITIKLKISYMAAREGISILELFLNSIIKTFWIRNISEDLSLLKNFDEPEL